MGQIIMKKNIPDWIEIDLHDKNSAIIRKFNIDFYSSALYQKWQRGCSWPFICNKIYLARKINLFKEDIIYSYETFS